MLHTHWLWDSHERKVCDLKAFRSLQIGSLSIGLNRAPHEGHCYNSITGACQFHFVIDETKLVININA